MDATTRIAPQGMSMPILAPEPALYPETLFDTPSAHGPVRRWWVIHTKPRQEKSLARAMYDKGVPFFLPLISKRLVVRGRILRSFLPLFAGYIFVLADHDDQVVVLATRRAARCLDVPDQPRMWHDLRQIQQLIASGAPITPED